MLFYKNARTAITHRPLHHKSHKFDFQLSNTLIYIIVNIIPPAVTELIKCKYNYFWVCDKLCACRYFLEYIVCCCLKNKCRAHYVDCDMSLVLIVILVSLIVLQNHILHIYTLCGIYTFIIEIQVCSLV